MERSDPTHVLTISVPLRVIDTEGAFDHNPLEEALRVIMPLTRLATTGAVCDDITVSVQEIQSLLTREPWRRHIGFPEDADLDPVTPC